MVNLNFLRDKRARWTVVLIFAILCGSIIAVKVVYPQCQAYRQIQAARQQFRELVAPVARIKVLSERPGETPKKGGGSAVVVYSELNELGTGYDTYLLTCNHVIEVPIFEAGEDVKMPWGSIKTFKKIGTKYETESIEFFDEYGNSRKVMGRIVAHSPNTAFNLDEDGNFSVKDDEKSGNDLALIKLETSEHFSTAKLISRERYKDLYIMQKVRLVGCSLGDKPIPTLGEITRLEEGWTSTSADMIFGNSGGAAYLEETNELIGITNAIRLTTMSQALPHMGLIRPINRIYDWLDTIGYGFLYNENYSSATRFAVIRAESDGLKFAARDQARILEKQLKDSHAASDKKIKELEDKIAELECRLEEIICNQGVGPEPAPAAPPPQPTHSSKVVLPIE